MKLRIILMATAGMCLSHGVYAQSADQCTIAPTCAELGYQQKATDCNGQRALKCPFDQTQVFCGGTACSEDFKLSACDSSIGTCAECGGKYKYTKCNSGWTLSSGNCVANVCSASDYPYTSAPDASIGTVISCKPGAAAIRYAYSKCNDGWYLSGGRCIITSCASSYDLRSCPFNANCSSCQSGKTTYYKFSSCQEGTWTGSYCQTDSNCSGWYESTGWYSTGHDTCIGQDTGNTYYKDTSCAGIVNTYNDDINNSHYCYDISKLSSGQCIHENTCGD